MYSNCRYPNLVELVKYHPYNIHTYADHAGVTDEIFEQVLNGQDDLAADEALNLAFLFGISPDLLFSRKLITLDPEDRELIDDMVAKVSIYKRPSTRKAVNELANDVLKGNASFCQFVAARERVQMEELESRIITKRSKRISS